MALSVHHSVPSGHQGWLKPSWTIPFVRWRLRAAKVNGMGRGKDVRWTKWAAPRVTRHSWPAPQPFLIPPISSPSERPGLRPAPPVVRTGDDEMGGRGGKEVTTDARQWTKGTQGEGSDRRPSTPSAPYVSRLIRSLRVSPRYARLTTSFTSESEP